MNKVKVLVVLSTILLCYWLVTKVVDLYALHPVFGAVYELTSLIVLLATFVLPIVTLVFLIKSSVLERKKYILPLVINLITILVMIFFPFLYTANQN